MILDQFQHMQLTNDQQEALLRLEEFLAGDGRVFILQGYAGTGKTTMLGGLVRHLVSESVKVQLMAPTGRAAKVLHDRTRLQTSTVHRGIYSFDSREVVMDQETEEEVDYRFHFRIATRDVAGTVFIVDEASMLSDKGGNAEHLCYGSGRLLTDLIQYCKVNEPLAGTKLIFVGDPVQLPPVSDSGSKALSPSALKEEFDITAETVTLRQVVRTKMESGVMQAAQRIRSSYTASVFNSFDVSPNGRDVHQVAFEDLVSKYLELQGTRITLARKNTTVQEINDRVRERLFGKEVGRMPQPSDQVVFTANNYRGGVLNGEFAVVADTFEDEPSVERNIPVPIKGKKNEIVKLIWHRFAFHVPDADGIRTLEGYVLLNCLNNTDGGLNQMEYRALYIDFKIRNSGLKPGTDEYRDALLSDPFYNSFRLSYGYAVTCHKAQGGEWENVMILWDYDTTSFTNGVFYRWAYTAVTRSSKELFHVNAPHFHPFSGMSFVENTVQQATVTLAPAAAGQTLTLPFESEAESLLVCFGLSGESEVVQNHFLRVHHLLNAAELRLDGWRRASYEINYNVKGFGRAARLMFWMRNTGLFGTRHQIVPVGQIVPDLTNALEKLVAELPNVAVQRNALEVQPSEVEEAHFTFEFEVAEKQPFLRELYDLVADHCSEDEIRILTIDPLQYKDRYHFQRGAATASVDFEYNLKGFFGRVLPLYGSHPSVQIVDKVRAIVHKLKQR